MRIVRSMAAAALALAVLAGRAHAQDRIYVRPEPGTPVVAVQVLVSVGPVDEPANLAGISYVAARSVVEPSRALLDSLGARLTVDPQKDAMAFTLTAAPDTWAEAARALLVALFRDPVDSAATGDTPATAPDPGTSTLRPSMLNVVSTLSVMPSASAVFGLIKSALSHVSLVAVSGNSCSQPLLAKRPS